MRRGLAGVLALTLWVGGVAACGGDGDDGEAATGTTTTTAPAPTGEAAEDPSAAVEELCAKADEVQAIIQEVGASGQEAATPEQQARLSEAGSEAAQMMVALQPTVAQMLPSDAARFQECAAFFGGGVAGAPAAPPG